MIYRLCQLKVITSFTIKDKLFAKLPLYLRYLQTKKREEEINNDKKNHFQPTDNYQPDPTVHIV